MKIAKYAIDRPVTTLMFYLAVVLLIVAMSIMAWQFRVV